LFQYQLLRLHQICRCIVQDDTMRLVLVLAASRLANLPQSTIEPLQRVQNAAARLIFDLGLWEHVTPSLIQLHWLPIMFRVQYKRCTFMHSTCNDSCYPVYLSDTVQDTSARSCRVGLRSADILISSYLDSTLNFESVHSRTPAQLPVTIFQKIFPVLQSSHRQETLEKSSLHCMQHTMSLNLC
jgi:hypothetical protein